MEPSPPSSSRPHDLPSGQRAAPPADFDVALRSDEGCVRTNNEDTPLAAWLPAGGSPQGTSEPPLLLAVCDGMGGAAAGEVASREAAEAILRALQSEPIRDSSAASGAVDRAIRDAARCVFELANSTPSLHGMGTTATVCVVMNGEAVLGQVGDSRAYLLRGGRLTQLTRDQTLRQLMIEKGQIDPQNVSDVFGGHIILQAVGTTPDVEVDLKRVAILRGDTLLICSDGLCDALSDAAIEETLTEASSSDTACRELVRRAREAGASDNVTCVVARPRLEPQPSPTPHPPDPVEEPPPTARSAKLDAVEPRSEDPNAAAPLTRARRGWRHWLSWQKRG